MGDKTTATAPAEAGIVDTAPTWYHKNEDTIDTVGKFALGAGVLALLWYLISNSDKIIDFLIGVVLAICAIAMVCYAFGIDSVKTLGDKVRGGWDSLMGNDKDPSKVDPAAVKAIAAAPPPDLVVPLKDLKDIMAGTALKDIKRPDGINLDQMNSLITSALSKAKKERKDVINDKNTPYDITDDTFIVPFAKLPPDVQETMKTGTVPSPK